MQSPSSTVSRCSHRRRRLLHQEHEFLLLPALLTAFTLVMRELARISSKSAAASRGNRRRGVRLDGVSDARLRILLSAVSVPVVARGRARGCPTPPPAWRRFMPVWVASPSPPGDGLFLGLVTCVVLTTSTAWDPRERVSVRPILPAAADSTAMTTIKDSVHDHIEARGRRGGTARHAAGPAAPAHQAARHGPLVYPSANHTRFEHSLGVYHLADRVLSHLGIEGQHAERVRAAAFLHDVGQARTATTSRRSSTAERASTTTTWTNSR